MNEKWVRGLCQTTWMDSALRVLNSPHLTHQPIRPIYHPPVHTRAQTHTHTSYVTPPFPDTHAPTHHPLHPHTQEVVKLFAMAYVWSGNQSHLSAATDAYAMLQAYDVQVNMPQVMGAVLLFNAVTELANGCCVYAIQ